MSLMYCDQNRLIIPHKLIALKLPNESWPLLFLASWKTTIYDWICVWLFNGLYKQGPIALWYLFVSYGPAFYVNVGGKNTLKLRVAGEFVVMKRHAQMNYLKLNWGSSIVLIIMAMRLMDHILSWEEDKKIGFRAETGKIEIS